MYWRVRKYSVEDIAKQYAVHGLLAVSVLLNFLLMASRPHSNKEMPKEMKDNVQQFARNVTTHLLDTSYISYRDSTLALLQGELAPWVVQNLAKAGMIATGEQDLAAQARGLVESRQVSSVKIDDVAQGEQDERGMIPIDVKGMVAVHSADESGSTAPVHFHFRYLIGVRANPKDKTPLLGPDGRPLHMVVDYKDLSTQAEPTAPAQ